MSKKVLEHRIRIVKDWTKEFKGEEPLSAFLKKQFQKNKKYGSQDRRKLSDLMYNYYRISRYGINLDEEVRHVLSMYLFQIDDSTWNELITEKLGINEFPEEFSRRLSITDNLFKINRNDLFPFLNHASSSIDKLQFIDHLIDKPHVWIRLRKNLANLQQSLTNEGFQIVPFPKLENAFYVKNPKGLENTQMYQKGQFEIQDLASQICSDHIKVNPGSAIWDACSGSGGKSLYLLDKDPELRVSCTDIRPTILQNLESRMKRSGHTNVNSKVLDINSSEASTYWPNKWKYIIADVPCSGSGTWSRTPEQLYFFDPVDIEKFATLQRNILKNLSQQLEFNGTIFYLTCSLFELENESVTAWAESELGLKIVSEFLLKGYEFQSDTMYFCQLQKT